MANLLRSPPRRGDEMLRFADYRGMDAAMTETANEALDTLDEPARAELPALVASLVTDVSADLLTGAPVPVVAALDRRTFEAQNTARDGLITTIRKLLVEDAGLSSDTVPPNNVGSGAIASVGCRQAASRERAASAGSQRRGIRDCFGISPREV